MKSTSETTVEMSVGGLNGQILFQSFSRGGPPARSIVLEMASLTRDVSETGRGHSA
jgi:hypothetical protein